MPNSIIATCPHCQKRLKAQSNIVGKQVRCPSCRNPFVVQADSSIPDAGTPHSESSQAEPQSQVNSLLPPNPSSPTPPQQTNVPWSAGTQAAWGQQTATGKKKPTGKGKQQPINKGLLIGLSALALILLVGIGYLGLQFFAQGKNKDAAKNVSNSVPKNVTETKKEKTPPKTEPIPKKSPKVYKPRLVTPAFNGPDDVDGISLADLPTFESATDKEILTKWFDYQKSVLKKSPDRPGFLIVGRVQLEDGADPKLVNSQDRIHADGTFVHITRDLKRSFGLRAHGYEPVDIELKGCQGAVVDIGTIQLNKLPKSELRILKGKLIADKGAAFSEASIELKIRTGPQNAFGGTRPFGGERLSIPVASDGTFVFEGFSPAVYYGTVSVPGHVPQTIRPDFKKPNGGSLGDIKLEKQLVIQLEFLEAKTAAAFSDSSTQETELLGGTEWNIAGDRYPALLVVQENSALKEFRTRMSGTGYQDLGAGQLQDFLNVERPTEGLPSACPVVSGHVYLAYVKHRKSHVLFRVAAVKSMPLEALPATAVNRPVSAR